MVSRRPSQAKFTSSVGVVDRPGMGMPRVATPLQEQHAQLDALIAERNEGKRVQPAQLCPEDKWEEHEELSIPVANANKRKKPDSSLETSSPKSRAPPAKKATVQEMEPMSFTVLDSVVSNPTLAVDLREMDRKSGLVRYNNALKYIDIDRPNFIGTGTTTMYIS
jgi:hypothetical protein